MTWIWSILIDPYSCVFNIKDYIILANRSRTSEKKKKGVLTGQNGLCNDNNLFNLYYICIILHKIH